MRNGRTHTRLAFSVQILLLCAVLLGVAAVLMQVYASAQRVSAAARAKNDAVQICSNAAEAFQEDGTLATMAKYLGSASVSEGAQSCTLYLDRNLACTGTEQGEYRLEASARGDETASGTLETAELTVYYEDEAVCTLTAETYRPGQ